MHVYHPSNKKQEQLQVTDRMFWTKKQLQETRTVTRNSYKEQEQKITVPLDEVTDLSQRRDPTRCTGAAEQLQVIKALQHAPYRMF